jgi:hypothetical protein
VLFGSGWFFVLRCIVGDVVITVQNFFLVLKSIAGLDSCSPKIVSDNAIYNPVFWDLALSTPRRQYFPVRIKGARMTRILLNYLDPYR